MDGEIQSYINGSLVEEPRGVRDFTTELVRDRKQRILGVKNKASLIFAGEGYEVINDAYIAQGHCGILDYEARQWCGDTEYTVIKGEIILAECEFNETRCEVEAEVQDDGIGARVANNLEIPISPGGEESKNADPITPVTPLDIEVFDPAAAAGTWIATTRVCWDWWDAVEHAVAFITDSEVTAVSDWYANLPDDERYAFTTGFELRTGSGTSAPPVYSFGDLFMEIAKKHNLWIGVERTVAGDPVLRIEPEAYFYSDTVAIQHTDIQDLIRSVDADQMYAKIIVGSDTFIKEQGGALSLPFLVLRGFTKEEFHFEGLCNTKESLDLVSKWIIDSNVIEDSVVNGNDEYDDDLFIIQYDRNTGRATKGDYLSPGSNPYLYNEQLQNSLVIARYDLPSPVGSFFEPTTASFRADRTVISAVEFIAGPAGNTTNAQVQYDNDYTLPGFDTSNAWGNGTVQGNPVSQANSRYTASAQGYFEFSFELRWRITQNIPLVVGSTELYKSVRLAAYFQRYNSANTLIDSSVTFADAMVYTPGDRILTGTFGFSLDVGDYVLMQSYYNHSAFALQPFFVGPTLGPPGVTVQLRDAGFIRTSFVTGGGFVSGSATARIIVYEYDRIIDAASWVSLTSDPRKAISIGGGPQADHITHVLSADRNVMTGQTTIRVSKRP